MAQVHLRREEPRTSLLRTRELERENDELRRAVADLVLRNRALREALDALTGDGASLTLC